MYYQREGESLEVFLQRVHRDMMRKYVEQKAKYEQEHDIPVFDVKLSSEVKIK